MLDLDLTYLSDYSVWRDILVPRETKSGDAAAAAAAPEVNKAVKVGRLSCAFNGGGVDDPSTAMLLSRLDPRHLTGLQLKLLEVTDAEMSRLEPHLLGMANLLELDLSCGKLTVSPALSRILGGLPRLARLDLSNNRLGGGLGKCLDALSTRSLAALVIGIYWYMPCCCCLPGQPPPPHPPRLSRLVTESGELRPSAGGPVLPP